MYWALILLAWFLGKRGGRDLTTHDVPPAPRPPRRPPSSSSSSSSPGRPSSSSSSSSPGRPAPATVPASAPRVAPWPQAVPAGLPPWPAGWEPDEPVGAAVVARAMALLPERWTYGAGTRKTEKTGARWITYVATAMGEKRGVVAYRPRASASAPAPSSEPGPTAYASTTPSHGLGSRTLRQGDSGPDVSYVQGRLGISADGKFGPATAAAVRAYQSSHGLTSDGVVGPRTWASFTGASEAMTA